MSAACQPPKRDPALDRCASLGRLYAVFVKELIQLRRDRLTFATMIAIPVMQLILFGFAINSDPKHLPTAVLDNDHSAYLAAVHHLAARTPIISTSAIRCPAPSRSTR